MEVANTNSIINSIIATAEEARPRRRRNRKLSKLSASVSNLSLLSKLLERAECNQLESHLVDAARRFTVRFGGTESSPRDMQYGVPQGWVLGPQYGRPRRSARVGLGCAGAVTLLRRRFAALHFGNTTSCRQRCCAARRLHGSYGSVDGFQQTEFYLRNRRWGGCVYVLQMFCLFFCFFLLFPSVKKYETTVLGNGWTDFHFAPASGAGEVTKHITV